MAPHPRLWPHSLKWRLGSGCSLSPLSPLSMPCSPIPGQGRGPSTWHLPWGQKKEVFLRPHGSVMEKEVAIQSGMLAWRIPWTEESGRLQSTGSQRVKHD